MPIMHAKKSAIDNQSLTTGAILPVSDYSTKLFVYEQAASPPGADTVPLLVQARGPL